MKYIHPFLGCFNNIFESVAFKLNLLYLNPCHHQLANYMPKSSFCQIHKPIFNPNPRFPFSLIQAKTEKCLLGIVFGTENWLPRRELALETDHPEKKLIPLYFKCTVYNLWINPTSNGLSDSVALNGGRALEPSR